MIAHISSAGITTHYSLNMTDIQDNQGGEHIGKKVDKLIVGAIIGGAIGSVIGLAVAPGEGKKTRKALVDKSKTFMDSHQNEISTAKQLTKETAVGLYKLCKKAITKK